MKKELPEIYRRVLSLIPLGMERPRTAREIQNATKLGERKIRAIIRDLTVVYKIPIGAVRGDIKGYYIPLNAEERYMTTRELKSQIVEEQRRVTILEGSDLTNYYKYMGKRKGLDFENR